MTVRVALLSLLVLVASAAPASGADESLGAAYSSEDLNAKAPGSSWKLRSPVEGAPNVRAVYVFSRPPAKDGRARGTLISFSIENEPVPPEPQAYVETMFDEYLAQPPLSFKVTAGTEMKSGGMSGWKQDYTDRDGLRHFSQATLKMKDGRLLIAVLQSPDADAFKEDAAPFKRFVDGIAVKPRPAPARAP